MGDFIFQGAGTPEDTMFVQKVLCTDSEVQFRWKDEHTGMNLMVSNVDFDGKQTRLQALASSDLEQGTTSLCI